MVGMLSKTDRLIGLRLVTASSVILPRFTSVARCARSAFQEPRMGSKDRGVVREPPVCCVVVVQFIVSHRPWNHFHTKQYLVFASYQEVPCSPGRPGGVSGYLSSSLVIGQFRDFEPRRVHTLV